MDALVNRKTSKLPLGGPLVKFHDIWNGYDIASFAFAGGHVIMSAWLSVVHATNSRNLAQKRGMDY